MLKLEQKRERKKLAAQNRDTQEHLKEMLPPSLDFSAEMTESQSISRELGPGGSSKQAKTLQASPTGGSRMSTQMPELKVDRAFGSRKKTIDATQHYTLPDGFGRHPLRGHSRPGHPSEKKHSPGTESMPPIAASTA